MEMDEIKELTKYNDERMNLAKERLAFEVTKLVHGEEKALEAQKQAKAAFGGGNLADMPTIEVDKSIEFVSDILVATAQAKSKGEAKRLIEGGGVSIESTKITDAFAKIPTEFAEKGEFVLHKGKKVHIKVVLK
jgi:tyrosyl-tRNA synthetase